MYADDIKLYISLNNNDTRKTMVQNINYLEEWISNNGLMIAHDKCQALYIGKNNTKKDYFINDREINKCEYARDLEIYIDDKLSFDYHLNLIIKKTSSNIFYSEDI